MFKVEQSVVVMGPPGVHVVFDANLILAVSFERLNQ